MLRLFAVRTLALTTVILALCCGNAFADNYFTMGVNDTLRIHPGALGGYVNVPVRAHFDGRLNHFYLTMSYPIDGSLTAGAVADSTGMNVPYFDSTGTPCVYAAHVSTAVNNTVIFAEIPITGYWDYNNSGNYAPYGTVKWEAGNYPKMFYIQINVSQQCPENDITITGDLWSDGDARGGTVGYVNFYKSIHIVVGYMRGDINGDEFINLADMNLLIDHLINGTPFDAYEMAAADITGDGNVNTADLSALIAILNAS